MSNRRVSMISSAFALLAGFAFGEEAIPNWAAPATWSPTRPAGARTMADQTPPLPFSGLPPCRIADTRGNGFSGAYGPPSLTGGVPRNFMLTARCGIPSGAGAVSLNVTVTNTQGPGFILIYPQGGSQPTVSTLNYVANQTIANAAVVPLGAGGGVTIIAGVSGTDLILDTNGYYAKTPASSSSYFELINSSPWVITGKNTSSNNLATAILGQASATTGNTIGVWGETFSATDGARGVMGFAQGGTTGKTYGVQGLTLSNAGGSAGVYGVDGTGSSGNLSFGSAGVFGVSLANYGVVGLGGYKGVTGFRFSGIDTGTGGWLGYDNTYGVFAVGSFGCNSCASAFMDPHPTDASKEIAYVALEGPEAGTYFRGRGKIHNGTGIIEVPESFRMVSDEEGLTVQITPIGQVANVAVVSFDLDTIVVKSLVKELEFFYLVNGVHRPFKDWSAIQENKHYVPEGPNARMPLVFASEHRRALIATGIYNEDGTVNLETAERLGWAKAWREREEQARAAAAAYRESLEVKGRNR